MGERPPLSRAITALAALAGGVWLALSGAADAAQIKVLSDADAAAYASAFRSAAQGDFVSAEKAVADVSDRSLVGYIELQKLMGRDTNASYSALSGWLANYSDLPGADRVFQMALRRKPLGARPPPPPTVLISEAQTDFLPPPSPRGLAARA